MKLNPNEAQTVLDIGTQYVSNKRHYIRHGGVSYPVASLTWCVHTGEWPEKTPRHLDGNPANNDFSNLRPPGRAKRVTVRETMAAAPVSAPVQMPPPAQPARPSLFP